MEKSISLAAFQSGQIFSLQAGYHEFPFDLTIKEAIPETIIGLGFDYHCYQVHAVVKQRFAKDLTVSQPIQIYKMRDSTLNSIVEMFPVLLEKDWPDKIHYSITIPSEEFAFGTIIPVDLCFVPLAKRLRLGHIGIQVIEVHEINITPTAADAVRYGIHSSITSTRTHNICADISDCEETLGNPASEFADIGWRVTKLVRLPQQLSACTQDVNLKAIKIQHKLHLSIELLNEDGHVSNVSDDNI